MEKREIPLLSTNTFLMVKNGTVMRIPAAAAATDLIKHFPKASLERV